MIKLTNNGVIDKELRMENLDVPMKNIPIKSAPMKQFADYRTKIPEKMSRKKLKEEKKAFNNNPISEANGIRIIDKKTLHILVSSVIMFLLIILIGIVWFNISFADKEFSTNIPVNVDIDDTNINNMNNTNINNNQNNFTINIDLGGELSEVISETVSERVLEIINNQTNQTN